MVVSKPRVLIEDWLPVAELGIESRRERSTPTPHAFPPLNQLHVWWARRPVVASTAVVLGGLLPAWSPELSDRYRDAELSSEDSYRQWLLRLSGVWGDAVTARRRIDAAKASGVKLPGNGWGYKQAFKNGISRRDVHLLQQILKETWDELPMVADPTAGGGTIPFVATRFGLPTYANDLNGVAAAVLTAGVEIPSRRGSALLGPLERWGKKLVDRVAQSTSTYFPVQAGEQITAYIWANVIACPRTGGPVPLLTDKWLRKSKGKEVAVAVDIDNSSTPPTLRYRLTEGRQVDARDASTGFVKGGRAVSPYDNLIIDADYVQQEAQAGRIGAVLYGISVRESNGTRTFRLPNEVEVAALDAATAALKAGAPEWEAAGFIPTEEIPDGNKTGEPLRFGMKRWSDFFSDRQLLVHATFAREFAVLMDEVRAEEGELAEDILFELALMQGKALNYNSRLTTWHTGRQVTRGVFDSHNLAFKWTYAEFDGCHALYPWALQQLLFAYGGIARLLEETGAPDLDHTEVLGRDVSVTQGSAADLSHLASGSVAHVCMDPPYYDNVMYAELADFFYVWERRTLGRLVPEFFPEGLGDKDNEAVANAARFAAMGRRKGELADLDYESKMTSIFAEARRVLRDDGVLSVMFTHKRAAAWDTLGMGLLQAGFSIETSWPVNTEAETSLHQANMNSAASTIMLVCRKRSDVGVARRTYLDDIEHEIRHAARDAATRFQHDGIEGVDLLLSTYGPTLSVISQSWPVYSSSPDQDGRDQLLRPEDALTIARQEIVELRRSRLVGRATHVDSLTDFVLLAWDTFRAREFPFDTARLLALAVGGLDVEQLERAKVLSKSSGKVKLLTPIERLRRDADSGLPGVKPEAAAFEHVIDAVDTALYIADVDGQQAAKRFLDRHGYTSDAGFSAALQGLMNAIPRTKVKGSWVIPEAGVLDTLCTLYFEEVTAPPALEMASLVDESRETLFDTV